MNSVLAIYPTADKVEDLLKHYTRTHSVLIGHRLTTFPQLVDALCREANPKYLTIGPIGERLALEQAINQVTARGLQLPFPASVGVREHLLRIIHEFKSAAVEATDLRAACAQLLDEDMLIAYVIGIGCDSRHGIGERLERGVDDVGRHADGGPAFAGAVGELDKVISLIGQLEVLLHGPRALERTYIQLHAVSAPDEL